MRDSDLTSKIEPFDSFWQGPEDIEKGYESFGRFYAVNYLAHVPADRAARILVVSCGPGYFVDLLRKNGWTSVSGIDSDAAKIEWAHRRGLDCRVARAFAYLQGGGETFDLIFCEQELNHLTKAEMRAFLDLCRESLKPGGTLIAHSLNAANPITGAEALGQNFDHQNTLTEYSLRQVLESSGFTDIRVYPLELYVFYGNPLNYVGLLLTRILELGFRILFRLYGKSNSIFAKKIFAVCRIEGTPVGAYDRPDS